MAIGIGTGLFLFLIIIIYIARSIDKAEEIKKKWFTGINFNVLTFWAISISVLIALVTPIVFYFTLRVFEIESDKFDHYGSFVGGLAGSILSFAGVVLILQTLKDQDEDFKVERIDSRVLSLISIHRDNVNSLEIQGETGRNAIKWMRKELYQLYNIIEEISNEPNREISFEDKIGLCYIAFFFGSANDHYYDRSGEHELEENSTAFTSHAFDNYDMEFVGRLIHESTERRAEIKKRKKFPFRLFDGHQTRMGHYFRHLYLTIKWIDQLEIDYPRKYEYIKMIRAQLSTDEQIIIFYNSMSTLGRHWGYKAEGLNSDYITKYNLIKNIPKGFGPFDDVEPKRFYPLIHFEGEQISEERQEKINNVFK